MSIDFIYYLFIFPFFAFKTMNEFAIEIKVHHARVMSGGPEKKRTIDL